MCRVGNVMVDPRFLARVLGSLNLEGRPTGVEPEVEVSADSLRVLKAAMRVRANGEADILGPAIDVLLSQVES